MSTNYGPLAGLVEKCVRRTAKTYAIVYGGDGAGKTLGALRLAKGITDRSGGSIVLLNAGEGDGANWYDQIADFDHIALSAPETITRVQEIGGLDRWGKYPIRLNNAGDVDPRVALHVFKLIEQSVSPDSVIIVDGVANVWTSVRERVDAVGGKNAWQVVQPAYDALWSAFKHRRCHLILTCAAKITAEVFGEGRAKRSLHVPTEPEMRKRDWHKPDQRMWVRKADWLAWFEGRCMPLNDGPMRPLDERLGADLYDLLQAPEPEVSLLDAFRARVQASPLPFRIMRAVYPPLADAANWTEAQICVFNEVLDRLEEDGDDGDQLDAPGVAAEVEAFEAKGLAHPRLPALIASLKLSGLTEEAAA